MEAQRYIGVLRRYAWLVVLLTALGAGSAAVFSVRQPKFYRATATLLINPAAPNQAISYISALVQSGGYNPNGTIQRLADTYSTYLTSGSFGQLAAQKLGLAASPAGQISTALIGDTNYYDISVTDQDPAQAERIANGVATLFIQQNLQQQQDNQANQTIQPLGNTLAARLKTRINAVQAMIDRVSNGPHANSLDNQQLLTSLDQQISSLTTAYNEILTQNNNGQSAQSVNTAQLVGPAQIPVVPISPSVKKNVLFGAIAALAIGLLAAFLIEYLDYSVRSPEDVETATGQLPLAVVGLAGRRNQTRSRHHKSSKPAAAPTGAPEVSPALYSLQNPRDPISEAFRTLRTNLAFSSLDRPLRTLVVTSVMPSEGKSTVAANLAVVLAQSGKRVILIDADLRRPSLHRVFGLHNVGGFTDLLLTKGDLTGLQQTQLPNLRVMTSGPLPPNPAELLSSESMIPLIETLKEQADIVVFDSPPMGGLTDAVVLSARADATLLVVRSGSVRPTVMTKGVDAIRKVGGRPLGVVLNMVNANALGSYSYYYYYYYSSGAYGNSAKDAAQQTATTSH